MSEHDTAEETILDEVLSLIAGVPDVVIALIVVVAGYWLSRLVVRLLGRSVARRFKRPSVSRTVLRSMRISIIALSIVVAAYILGLTETELLLSVGVISAIIAILLAPLVSNFISGVFVLADQPYEIGDLIEIVDRETRGYVEDITLRYTKIFTLNNTFMVVPNALIRERDVVNYSAEDERTRQSIEIIVTYEGDLEQARRHFERAAANVDDVIAGGPPIRIGSARYRANPVCHITAYGDDGVELLLRYWVRKPYRLQTARSDILEAIWREMDDLDVEFAYPHRHHIFDETSGSVQFTVDDGDDLP